jgi:predicted DNA-binding transcriptional regulator YafY
VRNQLSLLKKRKKKAQSAPSQQVARIGWLLLRLLHDRAVEYAEYRDLFGRSLREFQRDLSKIRRIGAEYFDVEPIRKGRAVLVIAPGRLSALAGSPSAQSVLRRILAALGGPASRAADDHFLRIAEPRPLVDEDVTYIFELLQSAAKDRARVEFMYRSRGKCALRRIEPYRVVLRGGRYYAIGFDLRRRDWRYFGLDAIDRPSLRREGTFQLERTVPERYATEAAVGWIVGSEPQDVTFQLSPAITSAVCGTLWQSGQRICPLPEGGAEITLRFSDLPEAVRWSLRFGAEAVIVSPPAAVGLARQTAEKIARAYEKARQPAVAQAV